MPTALIIVGLAVLIGIVSGCNTAGIVFPGNGQLVIVDIDPAIDTLAVTTNEGGQTTVGAMIRKGIRYWDVAGARIRTLDQILPTEQAEVANAPRLLFTGDISDAEAESDKASSVRTAQYEPGNGIVRLLLRYWKLHNLDVRWQWWWVMTLAHETGHAIGLAHVTEPDAVMYPDNTPLNARSNLAPADMAEWARIWGSVSH
jgi:hypothetical protein